ncbi:MFS transporter [Schlesneria paludicola]|uniref:MFS transporter n=1 Tax=Schlesneria paludicola TaxID=360056 RepID=UPI00029AD024|nr:MFS transporter [Schlesneria paludicola]
MSETTTNRSSTHVRWLIVAMLMGFTFLGHFNRLSISVAGGQFIKSGEISTQRMGWVYTAFLVIYTSCMLPGGWLIDRVGPRVALAAMGLGLGFCVVLTGALGWTGLSIAIFWIPLILIRGVAGGLSVPLHPAAARTVSQWVPLVSRATANGLVTAGALIGVALTFPAFGGLMDLVGWPLAFVICGAVMMVFAIVWYFLSTDDLGSHPWANSAEKNLLSGQAPPSLRNKFDLNDFLGLFRNRMLVLLTLSYAALSYFQYLFFYWIAFYFEKELNLPENASRSATFTVTIAMAGGMAMGGVITDALCQRLGRRWGSRLMAMFGMSLSAVFAWWGAGVKDPSQVVWLFSIALGSLGLVEGIFWTAAPLLNPRNGGLSGAFLNTVGNAGGLIAPILTPWIGKHYNWPTSIAVACLICGVGAVFWLWIDLDPTSPKRATDEATSPLNGLGMPTLIEP